MRHRAEFPPGPATPGWRGIFQQGVEAGQIDGGGLEQCFAINPAQAIDARQTTGGGGRHQRTEVGMHQTQPLFAANFLGDLQALRGGGSVKASDQSFASQFEHSPHWLDQIAIRLGRCLRALTGRQAAQNGAELVITLAQSQRPSSIPVGQRRGAATTGVSAAPDRRSRGQVARRTKALPG